MKYHYPSPPSTQLFNDPTQPRSCFKTTFFLQQCLSPRFLICLQRFATQITGYYKINKYCQTSTIVSVKLSLFLPSPRCLGQITLPQWESPPPIAQSAKSGGGGGREGEEGEFKRRKNPHRVIDFLEALMFFR